MDIFNKSCILYIGNQTLSLGGLLYIRQTLSLHEDKNQTKFVPTIHVYKDIDSDR